MSKTMVMTVAALAGLAAVARGMAPEMQRYLRIRRM